MLPSLKLDPQMLLLVVMVARPVLLPSRVLRRLELRTMVAVVLGQEHRMQPDEGLAALVGGPGSWASSHAVWVKGMAFV